MRHVEEMFVFDFVETDPAIIERYYAKFHEKFFRFCDLELKKINIFFSGV